MFLRMFEILSRTVFEVKWLPFWMQIVESFPNAFGFAIFWHLSFSMRCLCCDLCEDIIKDNIREKAKFSSHYFCFKYFGQKRWTFHSAVFCVEISSKKKKCDLLQWHEFLLPFLYRWMILLITIFHFRSKKLGISWLLQKRVFQLTCLDNLLFLTWKNINFVCICYDNSYGIIV